MASMSLPGTGSEPKTVPGSETSGRTEEGVSGYFGTRLLWLTSKFYSFQKVGLNIKLAAAGLLPAT